MSFLRARQRVITALFPHPGNRTHLIPGRFPPPLGTKSVSATTTTVVMTVLFTGDVETKLGNVDGFTVTVNAVGGTVTDVQQPGPTNELDITFIPAGLSTQAVVVTYDGTGTLIEPLSRAPIAAWNETAAVP